MDIHCIDNFSNVKVLYRQRFPVVSALAELNQKVSFGDEFGETLGDLGKNI